MTTSTSLPSPPKRAGPFTLHGLVEAHARTRPDAAAVQLGPEVLTYGELEAMASALAQALSSMGVKPGQRVAIYQPKSPRCVAAIVGILKAGAAYVPIDPSAPSERARFILEHCGVRILFAAGKPLKALLEAYPELPMIDRLIVTTDERPSDSPIRDRILAFEALSSDRSSGGISSRPIDHDLAYVLYTSGSTGTPKGVAITHAQSLSFVRTATEVFELGPEDKLASHAPFNFDLSIIDLFCAFAAGATVVIVPETWLPFPARISKLIEESGITVWNSVPSALVALATRGALAARDLSRLRLIMFAGEPFPLKHLRRLRTLVPSAKLLNVYGQTEANSSTYYEVKVIPEGDDAFLPVGKTFPNYDVFILDAHGREIVAPEVEGELWVRGGAVASGYWNDPDRTSKAFLQNPLMPGAREIVYRTGDRFLYDENGDLVFRGRMDSAVKCRGFRVEISEVEAAAASHSGVHEVAVIPVPNEEFGNLLVMFVVPEGEKAILEEELRAHMSARLPRYMMPESILVRKSLPRSATGKIDRRALLEDVPRGWV